MLFLAERKAPSYVIARMRVQRFLRDFAKRARCDGHGQKTCWLDECLLGNGYECRAVSVLFFILSAHQSVLHAPTADSPPEPAPPPESAPPPAEPLRVSVPRAPESRKLCTSFESDFCRGYVPRDVELSRRPGSHRVRRALCVAQVSGCCNARSDTGCAVRCTS